MNQKGFTLIEMLVVITILAIIAIPLGRFFSIGISIYQKENNTALAQEILCRGMAFIMSDLRMANQNSIRAIVDKTTENHNYVLEMTHPDTSYLNGSPCSYYKAASLLYRKKNSVANPFMYSIDKFVLSTNDNIVSITIGIKIPGENGGEFELTNSYKIRT